MNRTALACVMAALPLAACATAPEDVNRSISMKWSITPDNAEVTRRTVEAGDIILTWKAKANATHVMDTATGAVPLVVARTYYGQLYCNQQSCFEDRNGDGAFDHVWQLVRNGAAPNEVRWANAVKELKAPVAFHAIEAAGAPIFEQMLGLVYTGPREAMLKEDKSLSPLIGDLSVGWIGGVNAPRTPDGNGWSSEQVIPMLIAEGVPFKTTVNPLGLTYEPFRATLEGMLDLEFQARAVESLDLDAKLKFDIDDKDKAQTPSPTTLPQT